eukprot:COSAG01_NODE_73736_length_237_cov_139.637681_1_plen_52_part_10
MKNHVFIIYILSTAHRLSDDENPTLAFPLHPVEFRSKPMLHPTRKPVGHDTD